MKTNLGETISNLRKEKGMTQKELADQMNVTDKAVSKWERNLSIPDVASIPKLAGLLGVSVEELMTSSVSEPVSVPAPEWKRITDLILKVIPLAMGVALFVTSLLQVLDTHSAFGMTGIALFCLALRGMEK